MKRGLQVGGELRQWVEGEALVFDDSFEHEVWWDWPNPAQQAQQQEQEQEHGRQFERQQGRERVVLILDFFHPDLPPATRRAIQAELALPAPADHPLPLPHLGADAGAAGSVDHAASGTAGEVPSVPLLPGIMAPQDSTPGLAAAASGARGLQVEVVRDSGPKLVVVDNFLSPADIAGILARGYPLLAPSQLQPSVSIGEEAGGGGGGGRGGGDEALNGGGGGGGRPAGAPRTSTSAFLSDGGLAFDPLLVGVMRRAAGFTGLPWTHSECLQLVRYTAGQYFAAHTDYFKPSQQQQRQELLREDGQEAAAAAAQAEQRQQQWKQPRSRLDKGGQRVWTAL